MAAEAGRVCIVTGGASGIGYAIAERMGTKEGCKVALFDVNEDALAAAKAKLEGKGVTVLTAIVDVTNFDAWKEAADRVIAELGGIDVLVQSAGITGKTGIKTEEVDPANFELVFRVNTLGVFNGCKAVLPHMREKNSGRILNIASIAGKDGNAGMVSYSASKAAVIGLTKATAKEYAETNITVNAIAPAVVRTEMVDKMPEEQVKYMTDKIPMKRTGTLDEIASLAAYITRQEDGPSFTTGFCWDATGGRAVY